MRRSLFSLLLIFASARLATADDALPTEPVAIGDQPQFVFDNYIIDNTWALKQHRQAVTRAFHAPRRHEGNPLIQGSVGYPVVDRDVETGQWRMWYQVYQRPEPGEQGNVYGVAYAESDDGVKWNLPKLDILSIPGADFPNLVWQGETDRRASGPFLLDLPEKDRRGYRYIMLFKDKGICLVGSHDGIHWDKSSVTEIAHIHSDTQNSLVYDPVRKKYNLYCRAKHIYRAFGEEMFDTGESRRVAWMSSDELWTMWKSQPQQILMPDEIDVSRTFNAYYGMPTKYHAGIFWGFLWPFKWNSDIVTEVAFSRDGVHFDRLPDHPRLIELGPEGAWDDGMVFGVPYWFDVGDEWWLYYAGADGPHDSRERTGGIGLLKVRREGFISLHCPQDGGVIATRQLVWPGGPLLLNVDSSAGEMAVRVSDSRRHPIAGFNYEDCEKFTGDSVQHEVRWNGKSLDELAGQTIRLEIYLKNGDLYTFRAGEKETTAR